MKLTNLPVRRRLFGAFSILFLLTVILGGITLKQFSILWSNTDSLYKHPFVVSNAIRDIRSNTLLMSATMKEIVKSPEGANRVKLIHQMEEFERRIDSCFNYAMERYLGPKTDIEGSYKAFLDSRLVRNEVIRYVHEGSLDKASLTLQEMGFEQMKLLLDNIQVLQDFARNKAEVFYSQAERTKDNTFRIILITLILLLMIVLAISYFLIRSINKPLSHMNEVARRIQEGQWNLKVEPEGKDELAYLGNTLNEMMLALNQRVGHERNQQKISASLIQTSNLSDFGKNLVISILESLDAQMGVFYCLNRHSLVFEPLYSMGLDPDNLPNFDSRKLEGDFGRSLQSGQIQKFSYQKDYQGFSYKSVLGNALPAEMITLPIVLKDQAEAMLVVGKTDVFSSNDMELIRSVSVVVQAAFGNLLREEETELLNESLTQKNSELQSQSEELATQTEELSSLTFELQNQNQILEEQYQQIERIEADLRKERDHLDKTVKIRTAELEKAKNLAEEADKLKTAFLANMSHEIRTPMNAILGFTELLLDAELPYETREKYVHIINTNGEHLLHLISDIIEIAKIESGEINIHPEDFMADDLINELYQTHLYNQDLIRKEISLRMSLPEDRLDCLFRSDYHRIKQVLNNLLSNAIKFTDSGSIEFGYYCKEEKDGLWFTFFVKDSGIGIAEANIEKIFGRFIQGDNSLKKKYEGTGLGLAISKAIVEKLGGRIFVESREGGGAAFYCSFKSI